ncbi:MAG: hypothetical protein ACRD36_04850 [Candidatus Acidiferrum sp.]
MTTTTPGGEIDRQFASVTGSGGAADAEVLYSFFVQRDDANGVAVLPLNNGNFTTSIATAQSSGNWVPIDPRDPPTNVASNADSRTLTDKSIAIQKSAAVVSGGAAGGAIQPGAVVQYTINFQVSDFFAFQKLLATDIFSDGQRLDMTFTPTLTVTQHGNTSATAPFNPANFALMFPTFDPVTGGNTLNFNVANELIVRGFGANGELLGASIPDGGTGGPLPAKLPTFGPTTGTITFQTVVLRNYNVKTSSSGDNFVKQGDPIDDNVSIAGNVLPFADLNPAPIGPGQTDTSASTLQVPRGAVSKSIYAINGVVLPGPPTSPPQVAAGDTITYRLQYQAATANIE